MNSSLIARGGVPVQLDRERIVFFNMQSTGLLIRKYGMSFWRELFVEAGVIKDVESLQYFLWAGLQEDADIHGETLTLNDVAGLISPMTVNTIAAAVSIAMTYDLSAPKSAGKAEAAAASPADAASKSKGPAKVSTTPKRNSSRSASSTGLRSSSSKQRSRR